MVDWSSLRLLDTLNVDWHTKHMALLVDVKSERYPEGVPSVLLAHRHGFDGANDLMKLFTPGSVVRTLELLAYNDIYYQFLLRVGDNIDSKLQLIHPASEAHVAKYRRQERRFVAETPALYAAVTRPYIERQSAQRIRWVENILAGISEQEQIVVRHPSFLILPDSKWDQRSLTSLYLLVLLQKDNIPHVHSLRDLTDEHLPLLEAIRKSIHTEVAPRYGLDVGQLRTYVHYMPTYYYLHLHIVHVDHETPGCAIGTAHLLDDIIDNIKNVNGKYYQRRTLHYLLGCEHELFRLIERYGSDGNRAGLQE